MKIKEVIINHYKSIKSPVHLRDFSSFHILVGPNNAGKTNVLDAVNVFFDNNLETERFFDKDADIKITIIYNGKECKLFCKDGIINNPEKIEISKSFVRINDNVDYSLVVEKLKTFKEEYPQEYLNFTKALEDYFKGVEINEELFLYNVFSDKKTRSVKRMGEGFKRLFVILFYIFHPLFRVIFIDEPEIHLHPSIIKKFLQLLEEKNFGKQIFFTTHHPSFVQAKYLPHIWRVTRGKENNTEVYGFYKKNVNLNRFVQEINDDNSGMLFADKVLLVEGVSDAIFMREMISRFYKKEKDIKVVYTSGKGAIDLYADLCDVFNIPYAVMLDSDAINSSSLKRMKRFPVFRKKTSEKEIREKLKGQEIFILEKDLERSYPSRYKNKDTKPLRALFVSQKIREEDLCEKNMKDIKEILEII